MNTKERQTIDLPDERPSRWRWVMALMLLLLGGVVVWVGGLAITRQYVDMRGRAVTRAGVGGVGVARSTHWHMELHGADAIRHGTGMAAGGAMLMIWGLACGVAMARRDDLLFRPILMRGLGWLSLACLILAAGCFYPPWRAGSVPFVITVLLFTGCLVVGTMAKRMGAIGILFMGTVATAIFGGQSDPTFSVKILLGFSFWLIALVHFFILRLLPSWLEKKAEGE